MHQAFWGLAGGVTISILLGHRLLRLLKGATSDRLTLSLLAIGTGFGASSLTWFWTWAQSATPALLPVCAELFLLIILSWPRADNREMANRRAGPLKAKPWLGLALLPFALPGCYFIWCMLKYARFGLWDAWAIWNMHARAFYVAGGRVWATALPSLVTSHPDYPLHLPLTIARLWFLCGIDSVNAPRAISGIYLLGCIALLGAGLKRWKGSTTAAMGVSILFCTKAFLYYGADQYADIIVAFYLLSAVICLAHFEETRSRHWLVLAGVQFGFGLWTKNEGMLFALAFGISLVAVLAILNSGNLTMRVRSALTGAGWLVAGMVPAIFTTLLFKHQSHASSDVMSWLEDPAAKARMLNQARLMVLLRQGGGIVWNFERWARTSWLIVIPTFLMLLGKDHKHPLPQTRWMLGLALVIYSFGMAAIYLMSPQDLIWYLNSSLERIVMQIWPSGIFLCLVWARTPFAPEPSATNVSFARITVR